MKRQNYYPSRIADQVLWLINYINKLPGYATTVGLSSGELAATLADAKWVVYVLGTWLTTVRAFGPAPTTAVDEVLTGSGTSVVVLPTFTAPALPTGVVAVLPGALARIFDVVSRVKDASGYVGTIGADLRFEGPEDTMSKALKFAIALEQGTGNVQVVRLTFYKYGHMGVFIESQRGTGGWEFLTIDTESPYADERPLLAAGVPEVRKYRMRFWDKGTPNGDWTDVATVTVSP